MWCYCSSQLLRRDGIPWHETVHDTSVMCTTNGEREHIRLHAEHSPTCSKSVSINTGRWIPFILLQGPPRKKGFNWRASWFSTQQSGMATNETFWNKDVLFVRYWKNHPFNLLFFGILVFINFFRVPYSLDYFIWKKNFIPTMLRTSNDNIYTIYRL